MTEIAFLGLGRMGTPMARRLLVAGYSVRAWNRTRERATALAADGAALARTPAEAVEGARFVITMLADPAAVETVVAGADGVADAIAPGAILVEMSTTGPAAVRALAGRLPAHAGMIDAPVMGSVARAAAGELLILVGGDAEHVVRVEPVLAVLGSIVRCGPLGSGATLKLVTNTAMITAIAGVNEALSVAERHGIPLELAYDVLAAGPLASAVARARAGGGDFPLTLAAKDLGLAVATGGDLPVADAARRWLLMEVDRGSGAADLMSLIGNREPHSGALDGERDADEIR